MTAFRTPGIITNPAISSRVDWRPGFATLPIIDEYIARPEFLLFDADNPTRIRSWLSRTVGGNAITQAALDHMPLYVPKPGELNDAIRFDRTRIDVLAGAVARPTGSHTVVMVLTPASMGETGFPLTGITWGTSNAGNGRNTRFIRQVASTTTTPLRSNAYIGQSEADASLSIDVTAGTKLALIYDYDAPTLRYIEGTMIDGGSGAFISWGAPDIGEAGTAITQTAWAMGGTPSAGGDGLAADVNGALLIGASIYGDTTKEAYLASYLRGSFSEYGL